MISSIKINGYRTFDCFSVQGFSRVNLLVGKNNTGKTTLLEALALLWAGNDLSALWQILARRGEQPIVDIVPGRSVQLEVDVAHFFTGHQVGLGREFSIVANNEGPPKSVKYCIVEANPKENPALYNILASQDPAGSAFGLKITGSPGIDLPSIPLTHRGSLRSDIYGQAFSMLRTRKSQADSVQYITTDSLTVPQLHQIWNEIALNPEEELVVRALRFIDPEIERVAPLTSNWIGNNPRGGFVVRRRKEERVPIGSFGDGIWRIFSLAVALSRVKGGVLLIDEIDTGLHYTVMTEMWKFVNEVSKEFNIQVFATTHSYDCVHSLATVCRDVEDSESEISIHRIETGNSASVPFNESEIKIAAEREIEIR